ncbi:MAG: DUF4249 domain-containing protein [Sphingobacteriales bacterium]|nr:MAG: DUF4249 domain-containing protein [Sphingobacteriales bacterium]
MRHIIFNSNASRFVSIAVVLFILVTLVSCEKEVNIDVQSGKPQLVVEGAIETGLPPYVFLTNSLGYFSSINLEKVQNAFVHDAEVYVSDGTKTVQLKEQQLETGLPGMKLYVYTVQSLDMLGELEKNYKLTIKYNGEQYEAITKIPTPTKLDSVISIAPPFAPDNNPDVRQLKVFFKDPDTLGNHVRYFTRRFNGEKKDEPFYPGLAPSVYSDEIINGTQFQAIFPLGEMPGTTTGFDSLGFAYPGDTVELKWCAINKATYDFYSTFEFSINSLGNPFAAPTRLSSNISNKAIGIWAGYGSIYTQVVVK